MADPEIFIQTVDCEFRGKECADPKCTGASHYLTLQEINEAVARKLGWNKHKRTCEQPTPGASIFTYGNHWYQEGCVCREKMPDYCHSIAAAWEIWQKMSEKYFLTLETEAGEFGRNIVKVWENDGKDYGWVIEDVYADTAPMAICLAFLKMA